MSVLSKPYFRNEEAAFAHLEGVLWPTAPICPHCGSINAKHYDLRKTRIGLRKCREKACRKQFTVRVGTVFESAHIPLHKTLQAVYLMCASKKGVSAHQIHRILGVTYRTAWFLCHRIREALRAGDFPPLGGSGQTVEVDETFIGRKKGVEANPGWVKHKHTVLTPVERGGSVRSFHIDEATKENIVPIINANLDRESHLMTDEARCYEAVGKEFASHDVVDHSRKEYGYADRESAKVNTNTVEATTRSSSAA
jgi:transposase-like protein